MRIQILNRREWQAARDDPFRAAKGEERTARKTPRSVVDHRIRYLLGELPCWSPMMHFDEGKSPDTLYAITVIDGRRHDWRYIDRLQESLAGTVGGWRVDLAVLDLPQRPHPYLPPKDPPPCARILITQNELLLNGESDLSLIPHEIHRRFRDGNADQ